MSSARNGMRVATFVLLTAGCGSSSNNVTLDAGDATSVGETVAETGDDSGDGLRPAGPGPTPADPPLKCPVAIAADTHAAERAACTFGTGASVAQTLGLPSGSAGQLPIRHIIVLMRENRSFDHLFGKLHEVRADVDAIPAGFSNPDTAAASVVPYHADTTCIHTDPDHQWASMHTCVDGGKMDGFVKAAAASTGTDGHFVMSYYEPADLPFDYWVASTWPFGDRHFASAQSGTYPSRLFMLYGTNDGVKESGLSYPAPSTPSIFDLLNAAHLSWGVYSDGQIQSGALNWDHARPGAGRFKDFMALLDAGALPNVSFVDGMDSVTDDHPTADLQAGEAWMKTIYDHLLASPQWMRSAIVWTYDEGGAFFDHVPPPTACVARPGNPLDAPYTELGVRVPFAVISPWSKPNYVSHTPREHSSITRFIEAVFDLPALTARDANSDALLDFFDFSSCTPPMKTPPAAPAPGSGGCK